MIEVNCSVDVVDYQFVFIYLVVKLYGALAASEQYASVNHYIFKSYVSGSYSVADNKISENFSVMEIYSGSTDKNISVECENTLRTVL